jgi:hypothetical protein
MKIPSGITSVVQPADISWNSPFKNNLKKKWTNNLLIDFKATKDVFKALPPKRTEIMDWVVSAWYSLSDNIIMSGFNIFNVLCIILNLMKKFLIMIWRWSVM